MMRIRNMCEEDLYKVTEIENSIFSKPWSISDFKDSIKNPGNIYLVVEEQNEIAAYCGLWGIAGEGQINNVAVDRKYRNQGIGYKMLSELIDTGKGKGLAAFTLEVRVSNLSAIALYHKLGFQDSGIRRNFYESPTEDGLIMWLY